MQLDKYKAGQIRQGAGYKYFVPTPVNTEWTWNDAKINKLIENASFQLGQLNSYAKLVPNIDLFIHLHITKEAVVSSRIEGTQTHFDEAFLQKENVRPDRKDDWQEVQNYTQALNEAITELDSLPVSSRLILRTHQILMQGVRGEKKTPGEYRRSQNWIGGKSLADAVFIPPHQDHLHELIGDLENFIHNENLEIPMLVKAAIIHYQFETIHPFLDGNGRIGRLLITLFLIEKQVLAKPLLYLSSYFEKDKNLYYDNLTKVRTHNNMSQWIKYFLVGIAQTSQQAVETLGKVIDLKISTEQLIQHEFGRRIKTGLLLHTYLLKQPVVSIKEVGEICKLTPKHAGELVNLFEQKKLLAEFTGQFRNRIFIYEPYLSLFEPK
ncbi:cell filamentation protein Fic [Sphingobacteriales bacterium TSM_CSM]|nr:cell filamentation protein Fic [Sphingobacteriales bacterium TSM_CSM]